MRRPIVTCAALVGFGDDGEVITCSERATHRHVSIRLPACAEHVRRNARAGLTLHDAATGLLVGSHESSRYLPI